MPERQANRESQDAADRGERRHPGPYESAQHAIGRTDAEAAEDVGREDPRVHEFRAIHGESPASPADLAAEEREQQREAAQADDTHEG